MADFDFESLLQNPLFLGGVATLLAGPDDKARALLGGIQQGSQLQAAKQQQQLRDLQLKAMQAQQDFNPADYMKTLPVSEGSATPSALTNMLSGSAQMPATLGGPIGGQTQMANVAPTQVQPEPGTPTGRVDMQGLLAGGMQAGLTPQAISQIGNIMDPQTALEQQLALKRAEGYTLGPQQARYENGQLVAQNTNAPPGGLAQVIQTLTAQRDALPKDSPMWKTFDTAIKKQSGELDAEQSQRNFEGLQVQRQQANDFRLAQMSQQQQQYVQNKTSMFSNHLQTIGIPQAQQQLDYIDQTLAKYGPDQDVPGYTRGTSAIPSAMLSEEGQKNRQAIASFANVLLKTRSGAAVTDPEQKRFLEEMGTGKWMPTARLRQGVEMMKGLLDSEKRNAAAGVSNDVLDNYMATPGAIDFGSYRKQDTSDTGNGGGGGGSVLDAARAEAKRRGMKM